MRADLGSKAAKSLIAALNEELTQQYPEEGANHFRLEPHEVSAGVGAFLVCFESEVPIACGAVRKLDDTTAEIKRMYVDPGRRGHGVGRLMLEALEAEATGLSCTRLVLETGLRQVAAMSLYTSAGFVEIQRFGEYENSPLSICMEKRLYS